ncbi:MAG: hypothetical protein WDA47_09370 [Bacilli bacterium]
MTYSKLIPGEFVFPVNSTSVRNWIRLIPGRDAEIRGLFPTPTSGSATSVYAKALVDNDNDTLIVMNPGLSGANQIKKYQMSTGVSTNVLQTPLGNVRHSVWSPDKTLFLNTCSVEPYLQIWNKSSMELAPTQPLVGTFPGAARDLAFSPDGTKLAVSHATSPYLTVLNWPSLTPAATIPDLLGGTGVSCAWSPDGQHLAVLRTSSSTSGGFAVVVYETVNWTSINAPNYTGGGTRSDALLSFSPTGDYLVFLGTSTTGGLNILNMSSLTWSNIPLPSGYGLNNGSSAGFWMDDHTVLMAYSTNSAGTRFLLMDVENLQIIRDYPTAMETTVGVPSPAVGLSYRRIAGTVQDVNLDPASRVVRVLHRDTGTPLGETVSDPVDGSFEVILFSPEPVIVLSVGDGTEVTKLIDAVVPAPVN